MQSKEKLIDVKGDQIEEQYNSEDKKNISHGRVNNTIFLRHFKE